jgi:hypothetical protein
MLTSVSQTLMVFAGVSAKLTSTMKTGRGGGILPYPTSLLSDVSHLQNHILCRKTPEMSQVRNGPCTVGLFSLSTGVRHVNRDKIPSMS